MPVSTAQYTSVAVEMEKLYADAELRLIETVRKHLAQGIMHTGWAERKLIEVSQVKRKTGLILADVMKRRGVLVNEAIIGALNGAADAFRLDAAAGPAPMTIPFQNMGGNAWKAASIISDLTQRLDAADRTILRKTDDAYANIVARSAAMMATGTTTLRQAVQEELNEFAKNGISSFVDSAGRSWDMATYAEMATLTAIERATREGYIGSMKDYGYDLAIISAHAGACPLCVAWEDVVISVSGSSKEYPSLEDAEAGGCFHPRCLHHLTTYYEGITTGGRNAPREVQPESSAYAARSDKRALERAERIWKRRMAAAVDPKAERAAYNKVREYQGRIRDLIKTYNDRVPESRDRLMRDWSHEGGRVTLSQAAKAFREDK